MRTFESRLEDCSTTVLPAGATVPLEERSLVWYLVIDQIVIEVR
jgi:hypothetical protein